MTPTSSRHLFVATPCYGGMVTQSYLQSVLALALDAVGTPLRVSLATLGQDALITRSRNTLVARFLASDASDLLFVDADIGFSTGDVVRLLKADRDVIGGMYPLRANRWSPAAVRRLRLGETLSTAGLDYVGEAIGHPDRDGLLPARFAGTGFLMISRQAILRLTEAYPELRCRHAHVAGEPDLETHALFDCLIDPDTREYLSEDYAFCARWRRLGGEIWLDPGCRLIHCGMSEFAGDASLRHRAATA